MKIHSFPAERPKATSAVSWKDFTSGLAIGIVAGMLMLIIAEIIHG